MTTLKTALEMTSLLAVAASGLRDSYNARKQLRSEQGVGHSYVNSLWNKFIDITLLAFDMASIMSGILPTIQFLL
jgi:hypothetical protein